MYQSRIWLLGIIIAITLAMAASGALAQYGGYEYSSPPAAGSQVKTALQTALTHAGFAAKYESAQEVTLHLHHVLNCLVGPKGGGFDAAAGNPCQGQGNGLLPDLENNKNSLQYGEVWWAARITAEAVVIKDLPAQKAAAHIISQVLADVQKLVK